MLKTTTSTALALALLAAPAFAQSDDSAKTRQQQAQSQQQTGQDRQRQGAETRQQGGQQQAGQQQGGQQQARGTMSPEQMVVSQRRVIGALNEAGFRDVRIMDAAYLVFAMTENDEQVMMVVNSAGQPIGGQGGMGQRQGTQRQ